MAEVTVTNPAEKKMQMLLMMQQFRNRSSTFGGETELERVIKQQAEQRRQEAADRRAEEAGARQERNVQSEIETRQRTRDLQEWEAGQRNIQDWLEDERKRQLQDVQVPYIKQQTAEAAARTEGAKATTEKTRAETTKLGVQTQQERVDLEAKRDWQTNQQIEAMRTDARNAWNAGVMNVSSGNPSALSPENATVMENAYRILSGNKAFSLPRTADGSLDPQVVPRLSTMMFDAKGQPSADFAKDLKAVEKPATNFESYMRAYNEAKAKGDKEAVKFYGHKLMRESALTVNNTQAGVLQGMLDDGDLQGYKTLLNEWNQGKTGAGTKKEVYPTAEAQKNTRDGLDTLAAIDRLEQQWSGLVKSNAVPPTGRIVTPFYDILATLQMSNSDVQAFRANLMDVVARYRLFITGKASNEKEMGDLLRAVPNETDDTRAFYKKLREMRWKTTRRIRMDIGAQQALGMKTPDLGPDFAPISPKEVLQRWGSPDITTDSGRRIAVAGSIGPGTQIIGQQGGQSSRLGGTAEFRQKSGGIGYSVEAGDLQKYYDNLDPRLKPYFEQLSPEDQVRVMQGGGQ